MSEYYRVKRINGLEGLKEKLKKLEEEEKKEKKSDEAVVVPEKVNMPEAKTGGKTENIDWKEFEEGLKFLIPFLGLYNNNQVNEIRRDLTETRRELAETRLVAEHTQSMINHDIGIIKLLLGVGTLFGLFYLARKISLNLNQIPVSRGIPIPGVPGAVGYDNTRRWL